MTRRLFDTSAYETEFTADVVETRDRDGAVAIALDGTLFYPESGGQPADSGAIDGEELLGLEEDGETIWHLVSNAPQGRTVHGIVNWNRRLDHMQQHTGQHLLSAVCADKFRLETVSFHLGAEGCTIDLDGPAPNAGALHQIEDQVNRHIRECRPVRAQFPNARQLATMRLRKPLNLKHGEQARVVVIDGLDWSGCCGTHVRCTGELGVIKLLKTERVKGGLTRLHFIVGQRGAEDYRAKHEVLMETASSLSVAPLELAAAVSKLSEQERALRREVKRLRQELAPHEGAALAEKAVRLANGIAFVCEGFPERDGKELGFLLNAITERPRTVAFLSAGESPKAFALSRSEDLAFDTGEMLRSALEGLDAKGGGKGAMARGGGALSDADLAQIVERVRLAVEALGG